MRNYYAFCPLDTSCEKDTDITVFLVDFQSTEKVGSTHTFISHMLRTVVTQAMAS